MNLVLSIIPQIEKKSYIVFNPIPDLPLIVAEKKGVGYFGGRSFVKGFYILIQALKRINRLQDVEVYMTKTAK